MEKPFPRTEGWTSSLEEIPEVKHSVVEEFFQNSEEKRHLTDGYAFSKAKKIETSGKPLRINHARFEGVHSFLLDIQNQVRLK